MYEYIEKIRKYIKLKYNKEITILEQDKTFEDYFYTKKVRGKRIGEIYGFPSVLHSWCNTRLKVNLINEYLKKKGKYISYIGIAADEPKRLKRLKENESLDNALRRFKRQCSKAGVLAEVRKREHYEKPSVRRKKKSEAARKRKYK